MRPAMTSNCPICASPRQARLAAGAIRPIPGKAIPDAQSRRERPSSRFGKVIDFHAHILDPSLIPKGGEPTLRQRPGWPERLTSPQAQLADMDARGIDCHVITHSNVIQGISWGDPDTDLQIHRRVNDNIAATWVATNPDRFIGAFGLPTQDLRLAIPEMERAVSQLGLRVLQISSCTTNGVYYGDPSLRPLWEAIEALGVIVFIHPHGQANSPPLDEFALFNSVGQSIEEAKVMSSLIYQGIFDRFPNVKIVMAHGGGFLPHYHGRIDRNVINFPDSTVNIMRYPSDYFREFYFDSCVYSPDVMTALIKVVGADRIVLGGDYPFGVDDPIGLLRSTPDLSDADLRAIVCDTPSALLFPAIQ